jgi:hypothetical protein
MTKENTLENGKIIKWMVKESLFGLMDVNIQEHTKRIKRMVTECLNGVTLENTEVFGKMENNMEKVNSSIPKTINGEKVCGVKGKGYHGMMKIFLSKYTTIFIV